MPRGVSAFLLYSMDLRKKVLQIPLMKSLTQKRFYIKINSVIKEGFVWATYFLLMLSPRNIKKALR